MVFGPLAIAPLSHIAGTRIRLESVPNAIDQAELVATNYHRCGK